MIHILFGPLRSNLKSSQFWRLSKFLFVKLGVKLESVPNLNLLQFWFRNPPCFSNKNDFKTSSDSIGRNFPGCRPYHGRGRQRGTVSCAFFFRPHWSNAIVKTRVASKTWCFMCLLFKLFLMMMIIIIITIIF